MKYKKYREKIKQWICVLCCAALLLTLPVSNAFAAESEDVSEQMPELAEQLSDQGTDFAESQVAPVSLEATDQQEIILGDVKYEAGSKKIDLQPLNEDPCVWVLTDTSLDQGATITGHFSYESPVTVSISHPVFNGDSQNASSGRLWTITKQPKDHEGEFQITLDSIKSGAYALKLTADAENGRQREYTLIIARTWTYSDPLSVSLIDAVNLVDLKSDMKPSSGDLNSVCRVYEADEDTPTVALQVHRKSTPRDETKKDLNWMMADMNWVSLNGGRLVQFDTASSENEEQHSLSMNLKPGLNVISLFCMTDPITLKSSSFTTSSNRGFYISNEYSYQSFVYLIFYKGEEENNVPLSDDAGLSYIGVTQYTTTANKPAQVSYPTQVEVGGQEHMIALPENMPTLAADTRYSWNGSTTNFGTGLTHETILLNLKTSDPYARAQVIDAQIVAKDKDYIWDKTAKTTYAAISMIDGKPYGYLDGKAYSDLFVPVNVWQKDNIQVKVTAADGTEKVHTIKIARASSNADISFLSVSGGALATEMGTVDFSSVIYNYYMDVSSAEEPVSLNIDIPDGTTLSINGKSHAEGVINLDTSRSLNKLVVAAADGISKHTYLFLTRIGGTTVPLFEVNDKTVAYAEDMLQGWNSRTEVEKKDISSTYWDLYKTISTMDSVGIVEEKDVLKALKGSYVYDVTKHSFKQATDYAAVILELIMLGENPYNYKGTDYVAGLMTQDDGTGNFGPFGNNIWALMALKAAGAEIPSGLITIVKNQAMSAGFDLDMRGWAMAAAKDYMNPLEIAQWASSIAGTQITEGKEAGMFKHPAYNSINTMTHACVMTGIAGAGISVQSSLFAANGRDPLMALKEEYMTEDGEFNYNRTGFASYSKDVMIALGDITHGSNVWQRYVLTEAKYDELLSEAQSMIDGTAGSVTEKNEVASALATAKEAKDNGSISKRGKEYYILYGAMTSIDPQMKADVIQGSPLGVFDDMVNALPTVITSVNKGTIEAARDYYEALPAKYKEMANAAVLSKYRGSQGVIINQEAGSSAKAAFESILALPSALIITLNDKAQVEAARKAYDALTEEQKLLISWAGSSVLGRLTSAEDMLEKLEDPTNPIKTMTVSFKLLGGDKHGDTAPIYIYSKNRDKFKKWIPETSYTFNSSTVTVYEVFMRALIQYDLNQTGADKGYVSSIQSPSGEWLGQFDNGPNSGWMYVVNETHPAIGLKDCDVSNGDKIVWHYTDDYTQEEGSEKWNSETLAGGKDVTLKPLAQISNGIASVSLSLSDLKDAIVSVKTGGDIIITPTVSGTVTTVKVDINKESLNAVATQTKADIMIQTPVGNITLPNKVLASIASQMKGTTITVSIENMGGTILSNEQQKLVGDGIVYDVSIISSNKTISSFDGEIINISLPYALKADEEANGVAIWYLDDSGKLEKIICNYDKNKGLATFSTTHLSKYVVGYDAWINPFEDVKTDSWFYGAVEFAARNGVLNGISNISFSPKGQMSRAMLMTALYRLEGSPTVMSVNEFSDVKNGQWYTDAITWANANGIAEGIGDHTFGIDNNVTREQLSTILYNYAKYKDHDRTKTTDLSAFNDTKDISSWAEEPMKWACAESLITGRTTTAIEPRGTASRAEVATMLKRFAEMIVQ